MILLVDNYDSFTYNLAHLIQELGPEVVVRRNDEIDADEAARLQPSHLVVSPGPGRPGESGATVEIVRRLSPTTPTAPSGSRRATSSSPPGRAGRRTRALRSTS